MKETAVVREVAGDHVVLEKMRLEACGSCSARSNCNLLSSGKMVTMKASRQEVEVVPGDKVEVEVPNMSATKVALIVYGIPLLVFVAVLTLSVLLGMSELIALILSFFSVVIAFAGVAFYDRRNRERLMPVLLRRIERADEVTEEN